MRRIDPFLLLALLACPTASAQSSSFALSTDALHPVGLPGSGTLGSEVLCGDFTANGTPDVVIVRGSYAYLLVDPETHSTSTPSAFSERLEDPSTGSPETVSDLAVLDRGSAGPAILTVGSSGVCVWDWDDGLDKTVLSGSWATPTHVATRGTGMVLAVVVDQNYDIWSIILSGGSLVTSFYSGDFSAQTIDDVDLIQWDTDSPQELAVTRAGALGIYDLDGSVVSVLATNYQAPGAFEVLRATSGQELVAWVDKSGSNADLTVYGASGSQTAIDLGGDAFGLAAGDANDDGLLDLMVGVEATDDLLYFENTGVSGTTFGSGEVVDGYGGSGDPETLVLCDFDGDGDADLLACDETGGGDFFYSQATDAETLVLSNTWDVTAVPSSWNPVTLSYEAADVEFEFTLPDLDSTDPGYDVLQSATHIEFVYWRAYWDDTQHDDYEPLTTAGTQVLAELPDTDMAFVVDGLVDPDDYLQAYYVEVRLVAWPSGAVRVGLPSDEFGFYVTCGGGVAGEQSRTPPKPFPPGDPPSGGG